MSHPFYEYFSQKLEKKLKERKVVVVYDAESDFLPFLTATSRRKRPATVLYRG